MRAQRMLGLTVLLALGASCLYPPVPAEYEAGASTGDDASLPDGAEAIPEFHDCTPDRFVDRSADGANRTVGFGASGGSDEFGYTPPCITIAAGQVVTFRGMFAIHPLRPGEGPDEPEAGSPHNPIPPTTSGTMVAVTFAAPGTYPYYCEMHYAAGMAGVVHVE